MAYLDPNHKSAHRRKRNPCGSNKPKDVANISGAYQREEGTRHLPFRVRIVWGHVTLTQANDDYKPDAYGIQLWGSPDGTTWVSDNLRHKIVRGEAGPDGDWNTEDDVKVPNFVVFRHIRPKWYYRVRVRALSKKECDGSFGEWTYLGSAADDVKPARPKNVRIWENSTGKRVVIDWDPPEDPDDEELVDQGVTFFQVQLSKQQDFSTIYRFDKMQATSVRAFRIADEDVKDNFYGRVRSIDAAGNKSSWIPATHAGNSLANATAQGSAVGASTGYLAVFSVPKAVKAPNTYETAWTAAEDLKITRVYARCGLHDDATHPDDGCPKGGSIYIQIRKYVADESEFTTVFTVNDEDPDKDTRLEILENHHRTSAELEDDEIDRPNVNKGQHLAIRVTKGDGNTYAGRALVVRVKMEPR